MGYFLSLRSNENKGIFIKKKKKKKTLTWTPLKKRLKQKPILVVYFGKWTPWTTFLLDPKYILVNNQINEF